MLELSMSLMPVFKPVSRPNADHLSVLCLLGGQVAKDYGSG
jgi:hypothetical protein